MSLLTDILFTPFAVLLLGLDILVREEEVNAEFVIQVNYCIFCYFSLI